MHATPTTPPTHTTPHPAALPAWRTLRSNPARLGVLLLTLAVLAAAPACTQPPPEVLCVMRNPQTGKTVTMYKEIPFKVPADYDEQKHIAQWKKSQADKGFTEEVPASR